MKGGSGSRAAVDHKPLFFSTKDMLEPTWRFAGLLTPLQKSGVGDVVIIASATIVFINHQGGLKSSSWVESSEITGKTQLHLK